MATRLSVKNVSADRLAFAVAIAREAGKRGLDYFKRLDQLTITPKGHQDMVSEADRNLETLIRNAIEKAYPDDGIIGEEHGIRKGSSGFIWVLDPIDGTANFVRGIPAWCVAIACVKGEETVAGVVHEPCADETFAAGSGGGATLNGRPIKTAANTSLKEGSIGIGLSNRIDWQPTIALIGKLQAEGGLFYRNASGALMLAYVAAGRLLGYCEQHMNAWDCLAGLLLVREAGGRTNHVPMARMLPSGGVVVAGGPGIFDKLETLTKEAFKPEAGQDPAWRK